MARSLRVSPKLVESVKLALRRNGFARQLDLAKDLGLSLATLSNFLNGKPVDYLNFSEICQRLGLDLQEIAEIEEHDQPDPNFIARESDIVDLNVLVKQGAKVILISGQGGVGKTTLAIKYLQQQFDSYIEFPIAKETKNITSVESLLQERLKQLGEEPGREFGVSLARLKRKLQTERIGVLIDNLEPALDENGKFIKPHRRYVELLRVLSTPEVQSVTLITSRAHLHEPAVTVWHYLLEELDLAAWQEFFNSRSIQTNTLVLSAIHKAYGGNTKAMQSLSSVIQQDYNGNLEAYWQANQEDLLIEEDLEDLVISQFNRLQQLDFDAYKLLCRMGCYRYQDVPTLPIEVLFDLLWDVPEAEQRRVVKALRERSLVGFSQGEYWLHPVIRAEAISRLRASEDWERANVQGATFWTNSVETVETVEDAVKALEAYYHYREINNFELAHKTRKKYQTFIQNFSQIVVPEQVEKVQRVLKFYEEAFSQCLCYLLWLNISPETAPVGTDFKVTVSLSPASVDYNSAYLLEIPCDEAIGSELNIILTAPSFQFKGDNTASLPLDTETNGDITPQQLTQTVHFHLTALKPDTATITAELYRGDIFETNLETKVQVTGFDETSFTRTRIKTQPRPVSQPDFILRVQTAWNETNSACRFQYQLRSFRLPSLFPGETNYHSDSLSNSWIEQMRGLLRTTLENISDALPEDGRSRLTSLGQYLFQHLLPTELQTDFCSLIPRERTFTLLILADQDASLPWELLHDGQRFLSDRFIIGRWFWELNDTRPHEFPVGAINVAHYADVEQPGLWTALLEPPGSPPPLPLPEGVLGNLDSTEAMRGLHLIRYSQSSDAANCRNAPVTLDDTNNAQDIERQMRPAKLNLRRNRPLVSLGYVRRDRPELTSIEQTWASAFIRAGCSAFIGSLWAVEPAVEAAFISGFYNRLWTGDSLGEAFDASRQLARAVAPDSLDWLAYVLFGDPMARPYRPVEGKGYAVVEPIGREIDDPLPPGVPVRFRLSLRRTPPVWHEERVIEVAENLTFENLQAHVKTFWLQVTPDSPIAMSLAPTGNYLGWFTLVAPPEMAGNPALVQVFLMDGMLPIHSLMFSLNIENEEGSSA